MTQQKSPPKSLKMASRIEPVPVLNRVDPKELMRYIEIEKEVQQLEALNALKNYELKQQAANDVEETYRSVASTLEQLKIQTVLKHQKVPYMMKGDNIQSMFTEEDSLEKTKTKEEVEYLEALNEEECARNKLEGIKSQVEQLRVEADRIKGSAKKLKKLYDERDTLLSEIFHGEYGSEKENQLEQTLENLMEEKQRFSDANYKWTSARVLIQNGVNQLTHAVHKWKQLFHIPVHNPQLRFIYATETRNNLIAAQQNINSTQKFLPNISFPYCAPAEMNTLNTATNNIYADTQTPQRHAHALECYDVTMRRAAALLQWFDSVIKATIQEDLKKTIKAVRDTEQQLRAERVRLIRAKVEESGGDVRGLTEAGLKGWTDQTKITDADINVEGVEGVGVIQPEKVDNQGAETIDVENDEEMDAPAPVPLSELAPLPSADELFGNISQLKQEHEKETAEFIKTQEVNRARMEQGLQAKLQARRQKKAA